jgi:hypothetical protein
MSAFSHLRHIWMSEPLEGNHDERTVNLAYDDIEKALLSFTIDLSASKDGALDSSRPIKINGKNIPIPDLPKDAYSLKIVEKTDIDVTEALKFSPSGANNKIEIFYRGGAKGFGKGGSVGTLNLSLKIHVPGGKSEKVPVVSASKTKFCMLCQRNIPDDSVCCPYCCQRQPSGGVAGQAKKCVNCSVMLPASARFCKSCGREQPAIGRSPDERTPGAAKPSADSKTTASIPPRPNIPAAQPSDDKGSSPAPPKSGEDKTPPKPSE